METLVFGALCFSSLLGLLAKGWSRSSIIDGLLLEEDNSQCPGHDVSWS